LEEKRDGVSATIIAVAGIVGTLSAPVITELVKRRSAREDRQHDRRLAIYADLLHATAKTADNAQNWASVPLAELDQHDDEFLNRMLAQVRVVASAQVRDETLAFQHLAVAFHRGLDEARLLHKRILDAGDGDTGEAIQSRVRLGKLAAELFEQFKQLEEAVRRETAR
jgi:hypothetical protein